MYSKIFKFALRFALRLVQASLLLLYFGSTVLHNFSLFNLEALGVFKVGDNLHPPFESKFSKEELNAMAELVGDDMTLKEVAKDQNISYRQARKVRELQSTSPTIVQHGQMA